MLLVPTKICLYISLLCMLIANLILHCSLHWNSIRMVSELLCDDNARDDVYAASAAHSIQM